MTKCAVLVVALLAAASPLQAQDRCRFLCEPTFLVEPTVTFEPGGTLFETIFALDLATPLPRLGVTFEAVTKPFSEDNEIELESELNLFWLPSEKTRGWVSSHFDIVDKLSPTERESERAYTHKLNFELDTAFAIFNRLPEDNWWREVELEGSLDYVATGLPSDASGWSFSLVFVIPVVKGR